MTKGIPAVLALVLACMFTFSIALPTLPSPPSVTTEPEPNAPRTLLGKPYRGRVDSKGHQLTRWAPAVAERNESRAVIDTNTPIDPDGASVPPTDLTKGWNQKKTLDAAPPVQPPFPLVLNTFPSSGQARSRWRRPRRPLQCGSCLGEAPMAQSDGPMPKDRDEQVGSPSMPGMREEAESRKVLIPARRLDRMYDRGEWKSRLEGY